MNQERQATLTVMVMTFVAYVAMQRGWVGIVPNSFSMAETLVAAFLIGALSLYFFAIVGDIVEGVRKLFRDTTQ